LYIANELQNKNKGHITCEVSGSPIRKRAIHAQTVTGPLLQCSARKKSSSVETIIKIVPKSVPTPEKDIHDLYK
jgi:hypothetical protein